MLITDSDGMFRVENGLKALALSSTSIEEDVAFVKSVTESKILEAEKEDIRTWLYPDGINLTTAFNAALATRHADTGNWFLDSEEFSSMVE